MAIDEQRIAAIVRQVVSELKGQAPASNQTAPGRTGAGDWGLFDDVDTAMEAVAQAADFMASTSLEQREKIVTAIRQTTIEHAEQFARWVYDETKMGRYEDKVQKQINAARLTPGTEDLYADGPRGDLGVTLRQGLPFGVIVAIMPTTHPIPVLVNNAIMMLAAGNAVFCCPHPRAQECSRRAVQVLNKAIVQAGGPQNALVAVREATLEVVNKACTHEKTAMISATGGPTVVTAALSSGKKAVAAGPGNPPVLVDETVDPDKAARDIVAGHSFDNNVLCIAEKAVFVVKDIADAFIRALQKHGGYLLARSRLRDLENLVTEDGHVNGRYVGQDAQTILADLSIKQVTDVRTIVVETPFESPLVQLEQMMPVLPVVRVRDFEEGLELCRQAEHGFKHTAIIHSKDMERVTRYKNVMRTTLTVVNGPSYAGLGVEGNALFSHTLASPTGEGICTPRTFTRQTNLTICGSLNM